MEKANVIYLYVWSGDGRNALKEAAVRFPGAAVRRVDHSRLRGDTMAGRIRLLRSFRGRAIVFSFESLADLKYGFVLRCVHLLHRCRETVLCDSTGEWKSFKTLTVLRTFPGLLFSLVRDLTTLAAWWLYLQLRLRGTAPVAFNTGSRGVEVAYLLPTPVKIGANGGAMSHILGYLSGLRRLGKGSRVFTGSSLAQDLYPSEVIPMRGQRYFFWQAASLDYNSTFSTAVERHLGHAVPGVFYQRHTRFSIAGALLSRRMHVPLILEYNGPEVWIADHWDPSPFRSLIALCEEVTLRSAARILVVSEALKAGLVARGFAPERIRVNPNGVDAEVFSPGPGRADGRKALQVQPGEVLAGFAGSFSLWHGMKVLEQAIIRLLSSPQPCRLRFVLMGEGLLHQEMRAALARWELSGDVIFTGSVPRAKVVEYLDACDILVSPHIPMPDGSRFFGSPTKLFEYMAMGKAIVASRLEQLAEVLAHDQTGWLVAPGDAQELAEAILRLALDPAKREALGLAAREAARRHHS